MTLNDEIIFKHFKNLIVTNILYTEFNYEKK